MPWKVKEKTKKIEAILLEVSGGEGRGRGRKVGRLLSKSVQFEEKWKKNWKNIAKIYLKKNLENTEKKDTKNCKNENSPK